MAVDPSPGWYPDPHGHGQVRWWDGQAWTEQFAIRKRSSISTPLLVACLGFAGFCWLIAALLDSITAQGVAETPQPFQALGVALVYALAVLPLPVAVVAAVVVNLRRRSWRVALLWGAGWLFGMSLLVAFLAGPKSA